MQKPLLNTNKLNLSTGAAVTASQNSTAFNAGGYSVAKAYLNITAVSGTSPTHDAMERSWPSAGKRIAYHPTRVGDRRLSRTFVTAVVE